MRILNAYIARQLATTVLLAMGIWTFVMTAGHLMRVFDWLSRGGSPRVLGRFLLLNLPDMMRFTLPLSVLCATVLVFSQLSADNEITAMKACGVSLWQIISPGLILSVVVTVICFWLSTTVAPLCRYEADQLLWQEAVSSPAAVLAGSENFIELEGMNIRVDRHDGERLYGIHILVQDEMQNLRYTITAREGTLQLNRESGVFELVLQHVTYGSVDLQGSDPGADGPRSPDHLAAQTITLPLNVDSRNELRRLSRKSKHMDLKMLFGRIYLESESGAEITPLLVELHTRMSMALSPIAFLLLGIPFAIRGRRSEVSVGLLMCLLLALGFYAFVLLTRSLESEAHLHPELLVWLPNVVYQLGGLWALAVVGKH